MNDVLESATCPRCGEEVLEKTAIGGVCAKCFSAAALDDDTGWLASPAGEPDASSWPSLPGWTITGILGAGGMGRVYRAESVKDGTAGALKVLEGRWSRDPLMAARFEAEAHALMRLHHENIVRVIETGETDDGRFCIVMEFVDGCDLGRLLRAEKLTHERAIDIFQKVCSAVACAHEQGFAHRDIKPANILAARDGTVKLVDFGLAKDVAGDGSTIGALTATTDHFGSAYYLAPERMLSRKAAGPPADIYALGVLLYHLLTGQMPLGKYILASQIAGLPQSFDEIIGKALEADPAKRTASANDLDVAVAGAWRDHLSGADRIRKRRRIFASASIVSFAALTAVAGALWQYERTKPLPPPVYPAPSSATENTPWENSLGMKFVPVPGTRVLFSIWEIRRRDSEPFRAAEKGLLTVGWRADYQKKVQKASKSFYMLVPGGRLVPRASWEDPGFPVTPDHPACFMTVREAQRHCLWLTWKEQSEGRLKPGQRYRLPTKAEWLAACGGENAALRPGNLAGPEARDDCWPANWPTLKVRDDFPRLAPVGSFPAEPHGLFDMSGNVSEWVLDGDEDAADPVLSSSAQLRGPAFNDGSPATASFTRSRTPQAGIKNVADMRYPHIGFRTVLDYQTQPSED